MKRSTRAQHVSLGPSSMVRPDRDDLVAELREWTNPAASKDDRLVIGGMGHNLYAMCRSFGHRAALPNSKPPSMDTIISFLTRWGVPRLRSLPGVETICRARDVVIASALGAEAQSWFDDFKFVVRCGHDGARPKTFARVCAEDRNAVNVLAESLGLSASKAAMLAICTVLLDAPLAIDDHRFLQDVLDEFGHHIKVRAREASQRALALDDLPKRNRRTRRRSFDDVVADLEREP